MRQPRPIPGRLFLLLNGAFSAGTVNFQIHTDFHAIGDLDQWNAVGHAILAAVEHHLAANATFIWMVR